MTPPPPPHLPTQALLPEGGHLFKGEQQPPDGRVEGGGDADAHAGRHEVTLVLRVAEALEHAGAELRGGGGGEG